MLGSVRNQQPVDLAPATLVCVLRHRSWFSDLRWAFTAPNTLNLTCLDRPQSIDHFEDRLVVHF